MHETTLPAEVLNLVEMSPIEDLLMGLLPTKLPGVEVNTLIRDNQTFPLVLIRNTGAWGQWSGDERFVDSGSVAVHTYAEGINADLDAALLAEAVRVILRDSVNVVVPNVGWLTEVDLMDRPRRVTDWATAQGPVQYADLPTGVQRYETTYRMKIRKSKNKPYPEGGA